MNLQIHETESLEYFKTHEARRFRDKRDIICWLFPMNRANHTCLAFLAPLDSFFLFFYIYPNLDKKIRSWSEKRTKKETGMMKSAFRAQGISGSQFPVIASLGNHVFEFIVPNRVLDRVLAYFQAQIEAFGRRCVAFRPNLEEDAIQDQWLAMFEHDVEGVKALLREIETGQNPQKHHPMFQDESIAVALAATLRDALGSCSEPKREIHVYVAAFVRQLGWPLPYMRAIRNLYAADELEASWKAGELTSREDWKAYIQELRDFSDAEAPRVVGEGVHHYKEELESYVREMEEKYPFLTMRFED